MLARKSGGHSGMLLIQSFWNGVWKALSVCAFSILQRTLHLINLANFCIDLWLLFGIGGGDSLSAPFVHFTTTQLWTGFCNSLETQQCREIAPSSSFCEWFLNNTYGNAIFCSVAATRSPRKNTENSKVYNTNTEYLKMARKGGGHKGSSANIICNMI